MVVVVVVLVVLVVLAVLVVLVLVVSVVVVAAAAAIDRCNARANERTNKRTNERTMNKGNPTNQLAPREMYDVDRDVGEGVGTANIQQVEKHRDQRDHRRDGELRVRVDGAGRRGVR